MAEMTYDDSRLEQMFAQMDPKRRLQAMKGGFRRAANKVRKTAVKNLRSSVRSDKDLEKGVRALVYKKTAGFRVTIGTKRANKRGKGEAGYHLNRQGLKKPVLIWAELGTKERRTKPKRGSRRRASRLRESHRTGRMPAYGFMARTRAQTAGPVSEDLRDMVRESIIRTAKRYGCETD